MKNINRLFYTLIILISLLSFSCKTEVFEAKSRGEFYDDFNYESRDDENVTNNGWIMRSGSGGPGIYGVSWSKNNIDFVDEGTNKSLELRSTTDSTAEGTSQAEFYTKYQTFLEGTYAARVYFTDAPVIGDVDGDAIVETFFTITPLNFDLDPDYSEIDFEYLANGGWGKIGPHLGKTTWETYKPDPWVMEADSDYNEGSLEGWHTLVFTVGKETVNYYLDGNLVASHTGESYPETPMSINFNLWFIGNEIVQNTNSRTYRQLVDWVYFIDNKVLSTQEVLEKVENFNNSNTYYINSYN